MSVVIKKRSEDYAICKNIPHFCEFRGLTPIQYKKPTETDIINFVSATGMVEEMFTNVEYITSESRMGQRPAPGSLVFCFAEGLLMQSTMQRTGMAFLECDLRILKPTLAGDTLHVEAEVVEARGTSKPGKGLMRTFNKIVNQRGEVVATYNPLRMVKGRPQG